MRITDKIQFGWKQYYRPLPKPLVSFLTGLKVFLGVLAGLSFFAVDRPGMAALLLGTGGAIDLIVNFFAEAPIITLDKTADRMQRDLPVNVTVNIDSVQDEPIPDNQ
jgi:hypothetical protein